MGRKVGNSIRCKLYSKVDAFGPISKRVLSILGRINRNLGRYRVVPVCWMDEGKSFKSDRLREKAVGFSHTPCVPEVAKSRSVQVTVPEIFWRSLRNAYVNPGSSSVLAEGGVLHIERSGRGPQGEFDYRSESFLRSHGNSQGIVKLEEGEVVEKGVFLGGNGSANYYHWMVEVLSRAEFLDELPAEYGEYPLLVSNAVEKYRSFKDGLDCVSKGRDVIYLNPRKSYLVGDVVYIDAANNLPINMRDGTHMNAEDFIFREESIRYLRGLCFSDTGFLSIDDASFPKRVFLARSEERRSFNQAEVESLLSGYGFVSVYLDSMSLFEQAKLFSEAEWIVGPTGAAWTNIIFAKPGARCVCWMAKELGDFSAFSTLARLVGADLRYLTFETGAESMHDLYVGSYEVDCRLLNRTLMSFDGGKELMSEVVEAGVQK